MMGHMRIYKNLLIQFLLKMFLYIYKKKKLKQLVKIIAEYNQQYGVEPYVYRPKHLGLIILVQKYEDNTKSTIA